MLKRYGKLYDSELEAGLAVEGFDLSPLYGKSGQVAPSVMQIDGSFYVTFTADFPNHNPEELYQATGYEEY